MVYPSPYITVQTAITPQCPNPLSPCDISGVPAFVPHANGVYFAVSGRGKVGPDSNVRALYIIFFGSLDLSGNIQWSSTFPAELRTNRNSWNPVLAIGPSNELYVAFTTDGNIPTGRRTGGIDIVTARINVTNNIPSVVWTLQDSSINSVFADNQPSLVVDTTNGYLYLANTQQQFLKPQIFLRCFDLNGNLLWTSLQPPLREDFINNSLFNRKPSLATDNDGSIYLAYETAGETTENQLAAYNTLFPNEQSFLITKGVFTVNGTFIQAVELTDAEALQLTDPHIDLLNSRGILTTSKYPTLRYSIPNTQVDVVKFRTLKIQTQPICLFDYEYVWKLSQRTDGSLWAYDGFSTNPVIHFSQDRFILGFQTSGTVFGKSHTESQIDLVVTALSESGFVYWVNQGLPAHAPIRDTFNIALDVEDGHIYVSALLSTEQSYDSVFAWKLNNFDGTNDWDYNHISYLESAYRYAYTGDPTALFQESPFSFYWSGIQVLNGRLYISTLTTLAVDAPEFYPPPRNFTISYLAERKFVPNLDAYGYITLECRQSCA